MDLEMYFLLETPALTEVKNLLITFQKLSHPDQIMNLTIFSTSYDL